MPTSNKTIEELANREYKYGFVTEIEQEAAPPGLNEEIIRLISAKKDEPEWLLEWRLKSYRHWLTMEEPRWANVHYPPIDYQGIVYYSAPKPKQALRSLEEVDPLLLKTFEKLGIPLEEQRRLSGVAVDAVFDSVSVATTFKDKLGAMGIIFCSFSEAVREHPELVHEPERGGNPFPLPKDDQEEIKGPAGLAEPVINQVQMFPDNLLGPRTQGIAGLERIPENLQKADRVILKETPVPRKDVDLAIDLGQAVP